MEARSQQAALSRSPAEQAEYREGFVNGAQMVRRAQERGQRPFVPVLRPSAPPLPKGALPPGVTPEVLAPFLEVDPETGLQTFPAMGASEAFARGQVEGFRWAWEQVKGNYAKPVEPALPRGWANWEADAGQVKVAGGDQDGAVLWQGDTLLWRVKAQGFPGRSRWRPFPWGKPSAVALDGNVLWVATKGGQALALDVDDGAIRSLQAAPVPRAAQDQQEDPNHDPRQAYQEWLAKERRKPEAIKARGELRARAEKGDPEAMFQLAGSLKGMEKNADQEALAWLRKASELGHGGALMELGAWHYQGYGVPEDKREARRCFERAAKIGRSDAVELLRALDAKGTQ